MKYREKLLFPIIIVVFLGFSAFIAFLSLDYSRKKNKDFSTYTESMAALAATTNSIPLWNLDTKELAQNLDSFLAIREIIAIDIRDSKGSSVAMREASNMPPNLILKSADIMHEGTTIGFAILTFTDSYVRGEVAAIVVKQVLLGDGIFIAIAILMFLIISKLSAARKKAEDELEFRNLILSTQQEAAIDGILVVDSDGHILSSNRRFADIWSIAPDVIESKSAERSLRLMMDKVSNPDELGDRVKQFDKASQEKDDAEITLKDGRTFNFYSAPMLDPEKRPMGRVWYFRDVSAHKKAEQVRANLEEQLRGAQKMEAVGSLAGGIAHDFNNLLTVILSYTKFVLKAMQEGDPSRDDLLEVQKAAERAAMLTRQLLAFSRKQVLKPLQLNLNQVVEGIEKMLKRILGEDIEVALNLDPDLGITLADPSQIEQVLMNLVVNARDAMPKGGRLAIETSNVVLDEDYASIHKAATPGPYVQLSVSDSGCGMDKRTQERIFEPFFTTKEVGKGTGLGLSTVYGIVKQSGGSIWVYSELGQGTTFKIYLPMALTEAEIATCDTEEIPSQPRGNGTILVVEDEAALRKIAVRTLEAVGYTVLSAADGDEALHVSSLHQGEILLLLTDVVMPRMGGSVLAQKLSLTRPSLKVVYMSGYTDDTIVHHGVLDKGTHFISKPFTAEDLTTMVRNVLDGGNEDLSARQGRPLGGEGEGI
jgi:two-component system, cell cycle sensor histidine kinase and response regulator CckA